MGGKRAAEEDAGGAGAGKKPRGKEKEKGKSVDVIATFSLSLKQLLPIVQNVGLVGDTCTIRVTPEELCIHSQCSSLTLAAQGRFPPSFFFRYNCYDARDVTVNATHWREVLKVAKDTLKGDISVDIAIEEDGNTLHHDFFTGAGEEHVTLHEHHLPACNIDQEEFVLTVAERALSVTVATSEWRTSMDQLFKLSNDISFCVSTDEIRIDYTNKTRGYGMRPLRPGSELVKIVRDGGFDGNVTQNHRVEKVKKAAHIVGADELILRFVSDGPLEQHCAIGQKGRIVLFVCPGTDE